MFSQLDTEKFRNVYWIPTSGDMKPTLIADNAGRDLGGTVSPDGRWLAYLTDDTSTLNIVVQPFLRPGRVPSGGAATAGFWRLRTRWTRTITLLTNWTAALADRVGAKGR